MAGDPTEAVFGYLQGVVASQAQALQHESLLKKNGRIEFDDGTVLEHRGRKIIRLSLTLLDHGTLQDRFLFAQLASLLATSKLSAGVNWDQELQLRVDKTDRTLERLTRHLTEDLEETAEVGRSIWIRAMTAASLSFCHLSIILIDNSSTEGLANVMTKPATFATGSVLKEYHSLRVLKMV